MSQKQPSRPEGEDAQSVKYGDLFNVSGELASKTVAPEDAAMMQAAETRVYGHTRKGGPASAMQQAATLNERAGVVGHHDVTDVAGGEGVTVVETDVPGARIFTESVAGQVVSQYVEETTEGGDRKDTSEITIGEALEATAYAARDKPVDESDAAAIEAAEMRVTGRNVITPGGLAALVQSAAAFNAQVRREDVKIKLGDVLANATTKLGADKAATREDAEGVVSAELRNNPELGTHAGGVAASVAAAARINERAKK